MNPDRIWELMGVPVPVKEHRFHPTRKWRFDFAWPQYEVACEIEGGAFIRGRHNRPMGFLKDMEKYNAAAELGWIILRYPPNKIDYEQVGRVLISKHNKTI